MRAVVARDATDIGAWGTHDMRQDALAPVAQPRIASTSDRRDPERAAKDPPAEHAHEAADCDGSENEPATCRAQTFAARSAAFASSAPVLGATRAR